MKEESESSKRKTQSSFIICDLLLLFISPVYPAVDSMHTNKLCIRKTISKKKKIETTARKQFIIKWMSPEQNK